MDLTITNNNAATMYYLAYGATGPGPDAPNGNIAADGSFSLWTETGSIVDRFASLAGGGGSVTLNNVPHLWSGIVFLSIGQAPTQFNVAKNGNGVLMPQPPGFLPNSMDYQCEFAMVEFTYTPGGLWCDTTVVDFFGFPYTIQVTGSQSGMQSAGQLNPGVTPDTIFQAFTGLGAPWNSLLLPNGSGGTLRVLAPQNGIDTGLFPADYMDSYIDQIWTQYTTDTLTIANTTQGTFTGKVVDNVFTFTNGSGVTVPVNKPTTQNVFACNGALAAPNNIIGEITRTLGAGFNRSVLQINAQPNCNSAGFYTLPQTNEYSNIFHQNTQGGKAYGFPFDDVCDLYSSLLKITTPNIPTLFEVIIPAF